MKHILILFNLLFTTNLTFLAQNLIMNNSFEQYVPDSIDNSYGNGSVSKAKYWLNAGPGTSDYYHSDYNFVFPGRVPQNDNGNQVAHIGNAYAGIYAFEITTPINIRDYIRTQLISPLVAGQTYTVSFYASLADSSNFAAGFGVNLSAVQENNFNGYLLLANEHLHTPGTITNKQGWTLVTGTYNALGGEQYITIGGFFDDLSSDTVTVGGSYPMAYYYIDDVFVGNNDTISGINSYETSRFKIYPNPFSTQTILSSSIPFNHANIIVYNSLGETMKRINNFSGQEIILQRDNLPSGLYFIHVTQNNNISSIYKLVISGDN